MVIVYGNRYVSVKRRIPQKYPDSTLFKVASEFVATKEAEFAQNGKLPEAWFDSIFWSVMEE